MIQAPGSAPSTTSSSPRLDQLQRALLAALPSASITVGGVAAPLELGTPTEPPILASAEVIEDAVLTAHRPVSGREIPFAAFLDGTQRSELVGSLGDGVPIVSGVVAAAVREWRDGGAQTWAHARRHRVYVPRRALDAATWDAVSGLGVSVIDTSADAPELEDAHPAAMRDAALKAIRGDRERLELQLAHRWTDERTETLYVDGGLRGSEMLAQSPAAVGVIKTHQTLYGDRAARQVIFNLREGERTSVFVVASSRRLPVPVASWYLRLRDGGGDPLWGLVRVEIAYMSSATPMAWRARADAVTRRILAERMPTAHPDARWHTMVYGIRDCEVFLKATQ